MRRSLVTLGLVLCVVATACGGGGAPTTTTETPGVSAGTQQTPRSAPGYRDESPQPGPTDIAPTATPKSGYDY